jgi:hypothetical protein
MSTREPSSGHFGDSLPGWPPGCGRSPGKDWLVKWLSDLRWRFRLMNKGLILLQISSWFGMLNEAVN